MLRFLVFLKTLSYYGLGGGALVCAGAWVFLTGWNVSHLPVKDNAWQWPVLAMVAAMLLGTLSLHWQEMRRDRRARES